MQVLSGGIRIKKIPLKISLPGINYITGLAFWIIFCLNYLYLDRLMSIATNDKFRFGVFALGLSVIVVLFSLKLVENIFLALAIFVFSGIAILSAWINQIGWIQLLAYIRIPLGVYLIYHIVNNYLSTTGRAKMVLRFMLAIAVIQLPLIALQRLAYPWIPDWFKLNSSLTDFGMGSFNGDTSMAFALIGLVIILLFDGRVEINIKHRWFLAGWLSLTVLFSNSQIQHITIALVWVVYLLIHLRAKTIIVLSIASLLIVAAVIFLSQSGLMTFPLLQSTLIKVSQVSEVFESNVDYDVFLSGGYARAPAINYYLNQPINWIGDGPGAVYDTSIRERTIGSYGEIFTNYAEVGLIGWILSVLIYFVVAFPIRLTRSSIRLGASWVGLLMFLAINIVAVVKYPMGNVSLLLTYCIILIGHRVLSASELPHKIALTAAGDFE